MAGTAAPGPEVLKRLGGGRWQTRDGRFSIEPQSGSWVIVDAEQTDDLGLPLVRGPFGSLGAAKEAIEAARSGESPVSPLAGRVEANKDRPDRPVRTSTRTPARPVVRRRPAEPPASSAPPAPPAAKAQTPPAPRPEIRPTRIAPAATRPADPEAAPPRPPTVPDVLRKRIAALLGPGATGRRQADAVLALVLDGHDADTGLRWRLVDEDGTPIERPDGPR